MICFVFWVFFDDFEDFLLIKFGYFTFILSIVLHVPCTGEHYWVSKMAKFYFNINRNISIHLKYTAVIIVDT